ncbi:hypothetical protein [Rickettsia endosymbiont of Oedothorax gibbosus]|uniref:hypothetical protein n=1 Tax=Rickettsia endosymbiont of Oedothorax gibbosus TaxID=931099 RepID=UPI002023F0FC|nr:hypothetical protein [Rickettsia endosymbiont of Oedothorax gibbosus]
MFHHPRFIFTKNGILEDEIVAESRPTKAKLAEDKLVQAKIEMLKIERLEAEKVLNAEMPKGNGIYPLNELKKISSEGESSFDDNSSHLLGKDSEDHNSTE